MAWPQSQEYNEAIQSPPSSFADPELRSGEAVTNALGLPMPRSGNFADVYEVRCRNGSRWAVKCFTRQVSGLRERYQEISRYLQQAKLPFTVEFTYLEQGIRIHSHWFPILKMQWVEGFTLNEFVRQQLDKPAMLGALLQIWGKMAARLREAGIAHADLQHGNVLMVPGANANSLALKLIDYDGMFVPALAGKRSGEVGHPSYQHPQRIREGTYNLEVDRFPLLLIATTLRCLTVGGPALWEKYDNGDNLLFKEADLNVPTKSLLFLDLLRSTDPTTVSMVKHLLTALQGGLASAPPLEEAMPEARSLAPPTAVGAKRPNTTVTLVPLSAKTTQLVAPAASSPADPWAFDESTPVKSKQIGIPPKREKSKAMLLMAAVGGMAALIVLAGVVTAGAFFLLKGRGGKKGDSTDAASLKDQSAADKTGGGDRSKQGKGSTGKPVRDVLDPTPPVHKPLPSIDPDPQARADDKLSAEEQVKAVMRKLKDRNPGLDGTVTYKIEGGVVTEFRVKNVMDLSPVRALTGLKVLECSYGPLLSDLSPLKDMKLTELDCWRTKVSDLSPLKGMPLTHLNCGDTQVSDLSPLRGSKLAVLICRNTRVTDLAPLKGLNLMKLDCDFTQVSDLSPLKGMTLPSLSCGATRVSDLSPLRNMKLTFLNCGFTAVSDLSPLEGMPLTTLHCANTKVTDLSALRGIPLKELICDFKLKRDAEILRSIKTLETVNGKPVKEFWKEVEAKK